MGKEVVYCFNCGLRLLHSDFEKGAAFRVKQEYACAKCMPLLLEMLPPEEREAFEKAAGAERPTSATPRRGTGRVPLAEGSRRSTTRRVRPVGAVPAEEELPPPSSPRRRTTLIASAGAGLLIVIAGLVFLAIPGKKPEVPGVVIENPVPPKPAPPPPPGTLEEIAGEMLRKARDHQARNPGNLDGHLREFQEVAWKFDKTAAGAEALKEMAAIQEKLGKGLAPEMEKLMVQVKEPLDVEEYQKALDLLDKAKEGDAKPAWILQVDRKIEELRGEVGKKHGEVKQKAREAKERGDGAEVGVQRDRVVKWGIPRLIEEFDQAFGAPAEEAKKEPAKPAGRTEEGKAYLEKWKEAVRPATNRDYAAAIGRLEQAGPGLNEEATKREAAEDLKDLKAVEELHKAAMKAAGSYPEGVQVSVGLLSGEKVEGAVVLRDAEHLEIRKEGQKAVSFVAFEDVSASSLAEAAHPENPRAAAIWLFLEGEAEAAKKLGAADVPEKYADYAKDAREKAPRPESGELRKDREAKILYWGAARDFEEMETLGAAIEKYKILAKDYVGAAVVRKNIEIITRRSEAGKEYFFLPAGLKGSGAVRLRSHPELESCWTCQEDVGDPARARETYVEVEFHALPETAYLCWVYAGACCQETFLTYLQATDMTGPNPRRPSEKISYDVGAGVAAPLDPKVKGLKKAHAQHGGEKQASKWEWIPVPLPKYPSGGLKKVRLMTEQKGFSVGMALVTSVRKALPKDEELMEERKRAMEGAKARPRRETGLAGHWTFDDVAGGITKDASGRGLDGQIKGSPKPVPGKIGGALEFDGSSDWVEVSAFAWPSGGPVTVAFWNFVGPGDVKKACAFGVGGDDRNRLMAHGPWEDRKLYWDYGNLHAKGRVTFDYSGCLGKWTHVALVSEGNGGKFKGIYIDGALVASAKECEGSTVPLQGLKIGRWFDGHKGRIDDFRIYTRVLDPAEIKRLSLGAP
jgi:hypothetical protein